MEIGRGERWDMGREVGWGSERYVGGRRSGMFEGRVVGRERRILEGNRERAYT
jgi:hypothetical protein